MDHPIISVRSNEMAVFRVIPDRSISNAQNRKMWRSIHELMEMDHSLKSRLKIEGGRVEYTKPDMVGFDIVASYGGEGRRVDFLFSSPLKLSSAIKQRINDKHPHVTIEEAAPELYTVPAAAEVTEYRYSGNDIFTLQCDDREQTTPISSFLNAMYDMQPGDKLRLSFMLERVGRNEWMRRGGYAWDQMERKRVPVRARLDLKVLLRQWHEVTSFLSKEVRSIADDAIRAVQRVFMGGGDLREGPTTKNAAEANFESLFPNGWPEQSRKKFYENVFRVRIRLAVFSEDRARRHMIRSAVSSAFSEMRGDNSLQPHRVSVRLQGKIIEELNTFTPKVWDRDPNLMSCKEVGKLNQYPTAEIQKRYADMLSFKTTTETEIPGYMRDPSGIFTGSTTVKGEKIDVYTPVGDYDEFMMSRVFIGSPRMGKDTAIVNFIHEAARKGHGAVVLDVVNERGNTRGMSDSLRDSLPADKIIDLDMSNLDYPIYIGLNEVLSRSENAGNRLANDLAAIFEVEDNGRTRTYLREAIKACGGDLLGVRLLLLSDGEKGDYLDRKIKELRKSGKEYQTAFWESYKNESRGQKSQIRQPIINRLDELFGDDHLKNIFGQDVNPDIDFSKWLKDGKVILVRVPNSSPNLSELSVKTICQWVVLKTFYTKLAMADKDCCSFLVLNEPHQFMTEGLVRVLGRMLRECPKWRLSMLFAIHDFSSHTIPRELVSALLASSINWHIFKNTDITVYERLKHLLSPTFTSEEAMQQTKRFYSVNVLFKDGEHKPPVMILSPPPVNVRNAPHDNQSLTELHSRTYGRSRAGVEHTIFEKEKILFKHA